MPGDRLVIGEDAELTRNNLTAKKTAPVERIDGLVSLTASTLSGVKNAHAADKLIKDLLQNDRITDDDQLKRIILDAIGSQEAKKPGPKAADKTVASRRKQSRMWPAK